VTPKWIGLAHPEKAAAQDPESDGVFVIAREEEPKLSRLYDKYGVERKDASGATVRVSVDPGEPAT